MYLRGRLSGWHCSRRQGGVMYIILGAIVGAVAMFLLPLGVTIVSTIFPPAAMCNCCCCLWPVVGGAIGAFVALYFSEGGAAKGAAVGLLSGVLVTIMSAVLVIVGLGSLMMAIPQMWDTLRRGITDEAITEMLKDIEDEKLRADIAELLRGMRGQNDFAGAYGVFQSWLNDDRIERILLYMHFNKPSDRQEFEALLRKAKTMDYEAFMKEASPKLDEFKNTFMGMIVLSLFVTGLIECLLGMLGGLLVGMVFREEEEDSGPETAEAGA